MLFVLKTRSSGQKLIADSIRLAVAGNHLVLAAGNRFEVEDSRPVVAGRNHLAVVDSHHIRHHRKGNHIEAVEGLLRLPALIHPAVLAVASRQL